MIRNVENSSFDPTIGLTIYPNGPSDMEEAQNCVVRPFGDRDLPAVMALAAAGLLPGYIGVDFGDLTEIPRRYVPPLRGQFWVAEIGAEVIGMVAVAEVSRDVGQIRWIRVAGPPVKQLTVARRLLRVAATFAREVCFLKLIIHVPPASQSNAISLLHSLGFEYSRMSHKDGRETMEFFLNFYERPEGCP